MLESIRRGPQWKHMSWVILALGTVNVIFIGGKRRTFAVFISALRDDFNNTSRAELNWIADSYSGLAFLLMPVMSNLLIAHNRAYRMGMLWACCLVFISCFSSSVVNRPRTLFLTHTLLHGVASSLILSCTALIVGEYFHKKHPRHVLATTLISGGPYGSLIFGPLYGNLVYGYGWRTSLRLIGVAFLLEVGAAALLYIPKPYEPSDDDAAAAAAAAVAEKVAPDRAPTDHITEEDLKKPKELDTFKKRPIFTIIPMTHLKENPQIYLWILERVIHNIVMYSLLMNLVDFMKHTKNQTLAKASTINILMGVGESITFTLGVIFGDRLRGFMTVIYCASAGVAALLLIIASASYANIQAILTIVFFLGVFIGVGNTSIYATSEEIMRIHGSVGFPATKMVAGAGMFLAPLFSGLFIDLVGFGGFFVCQAVLSALRFCLLALIVMILRNKKLQMTEKVVVPKELGEEIAFKEMNVPNLQAIHNEWVNMNFQPRRQEEESPAGQEQNLIDITDDDDGLPPERSGGMTTRLGDSRRNVSHYNIS